MKNLFFVFVLFFSSVAPCAAEEVLQGPPPEEFPGPGRCATCHGVENIFIELVTGPHKTLQCTDCHIPGKVQKEFYKNSSSFLRTGFYQPNKGWVVTRHDTACMRCHEKPRFAFCNKECISCHMPWRNIFDKVIFVKDKTKGISPENIRETKKFRHAPHDLKRKE